MKGSHIVMSKDGALRRIDGSHPHFEDSDVLILRVSPTVRDGEGHRVQVRVVRNTLDKSLTRVLPFSLLASGHPHPSDA